jgi:hypothetical protein
MSWTITFYSEIVEAEAQALPSRFLANFLRITELKEAFGPNLGQPHTAPLGQRLFEICANGKRWIPRVNA